MKMRRAGERRHFVELQSPATAATSTGFAPAWTTYAKQPAAVLPASAGQTERAIASTTDATITHIVETDYLEDVRINHRILVTLRDGSIHYLHVAGQPQNEEMRNKTLYIPCEERAE